MGFRINTNIGALNAHANSVVNARELDKSLSRLSSGLRINSAADDASGMAIADSLRSQAATLGQAINNGNDAIGILQTADKAMDEQLKILDTIKTKATQAAQDGQSLKTRTMLQADINRLMEELDNIANTTSFNGKQLLSGNFINQEFQIGASSNQTIKATIGATQSSKIGLTRFETGGRISTSGEVQFTLKNYNGIDDFQFQKVVISTSVGTGLGALAEAIAAAISKTNLTAYLIKIVSHFISHKKYLLLLSIALISCFSQNLIPIHVAFIPLLIPPLLSLFNKLKIDRRAVACALTFGLTTPYMVLPVGFGLTFQDLLKDNLNANNVSVSLNDVTNTMYFAAICMIAGLFLALFVFYRKSREYQEVEIAKVDLENLEMTRKEWGVLAGLVLTLILQILTMNLPLSGLLGFVLMVILGGVEFSKVNEVFDDGLKMMGFIAFVILVAAGYGEVLKESGSVVDLVNSVVPWMEQSKFLAVFFMLLIGLIITMGIGTSFGTIPIIATLFCPICLELGFSTALIIFILGVAGALGDAGSPASETTMGTTVGLNADKQHDHIKDTCIPTFIFYNGPLLILGSIIAMFL